MKRNTLILLLIALGLGLAVYFLEYKPGKPRDEEEKSSKPAWEVKREEIASIELRRNGETILFRQDGDKWVIEAPLKAAAGESAINSLVNDLTSPQVEREFAASTEDLKGFGLDPAAIRLEMKLKNGQSKVIEIGAKDVIGNSAYARLGGGSNGGLNVSMIGLSLLTSSDKPLSEFRDRTLIGGTQTDLSQATFVNSSGSFELTRENDVWRITRPAAIDADESEISTLLSGITSAEASEFVSENDAEAAKFGLDQPGTVFTTKLTSGTQKSISIGARVGDDYYARVSDKPQIFKVTASLFDKLETKLFRLKSKAFIKVSEDELSEVRLKNPNLTLVAQHSTDGKWLIRQPVDKKEKEANASIFLDPLETRASEIIEKPDAAISVLLAAPAVELRLTGKDAKSTTIRISKAKDGSAYLRVEGRPDIYKVPQSILDSLSFKIDEIVKE